MPPLPATIELTLGLDDADDEDTLRRHVAKALGRSVGDVPRARIVRRAIDARKGKVRFELVVALDEPPPLDSLGLPLPVDVKGPARVVVVGEGPAGLFCAYALARKGIASIVLDRGKTVQPRRIDLKGLNQHGVVDADSNYCFGEGGAGTYSDGKLYTRSTKRGDVKDVLETLARHGAPLDILTDARPHIGSNLLPKVITAMREHLESRGVQFRFGARVDGVIVDGGAVRGVTLHDGSAVTADAVVVATGHSARDVYRWLHTAGAVLEAKPLAVGVRIEHPQPFINRLQYGRAFEHPKLPNAAYRIVEQVQSPAGQRGVFSFCMCPGGFVVPASTSMDGLVVNGMSLKRRDSPFANSGLVVAVEVADAAAAGFTGPFALLDVQSKIEAAALAAGGGQLRAPGTRAPDFLNKRASTTTPQTSYQPGLLPTDVAPVLDAAGVLVADKLRTALRAFERRMPGYAGDDAVLIGVETRTSAPVRIVRDNDTLMSPTLPGLFPAGEGAGYAGGIVSAALDGMRVADAVALALPSAATTRRAR